MNDMLVWLAVAFGLALIGVMIFLVLAPELREDDPPCAQDGLSRLDHENNICGCEPRQ